MKFSWQFESYKIEKASSSTSCKRLEPTPHSGKWANLFCNYNRLQMEYGVGCIVSTQELQQWGWWGKEHVFQGSWHIFLFRAGLQEPSHLTFRQYMYQVLSLPYYGKELREVKWVIQSHMCQSCATHFSSASPFQGDHEEQWIFSPSAALRAVLPLVVPQNPCTQGYELPKTWKLCRR